MTPVVSLQSVRSHPGVRVHATQGQDGPLPRLETTRIAFSEGRRSAARLTALWGRINRLQRRNPMWHVSRR